MFVITMTIPGIFVVYTQELQDLNLEYYWLKLFFVSLYSLYVFGEAEIRFNGQGNAGFSFHMMMEIQFVYYCIS